MYMGSAGAARAKQVPAPAQPPNKRWLWDGRGRLRVLCRGRGAGTGGCAAAWAQHIIPLTLPRALPGGARAGLESSGELGGAWGSTGNTGKPGHWVLGGGHRAGQGGTGRRQHCLSVRGMLGWAGSQYWVLLEALGALKSQYWGHWGESTGVWYWEPVLGCTGAMGCGGVSLQGTLLVAMGNTGLYWGHSGQYWGNEGSTRLLGGTGVGAGASWAILGTALGTLEVGTGGTGGIQSQYWGHWEKYWGIRDWYWEPVLGGTGGTGQRSGTGSCKASLCVRYWAVLGTLWWVLGTLWSVLGQWRRYCAPPGSPGRVLGSVLGGRGLWGG